MESERFESDTACLGGRDRGRAFSYLAFTVVGIAATVAGLTAKSAQLLVLGAPLALFGSMLGLSLWWSSADRCMLPGAISVVDRALFRSGERVLAAGAVKQGFVVTDKRGRQWVRLEKTNPIAPASWVAVADVAEGRSLLRALGLDASQTTAELSALPFAHPRTTQRLTFALVAFMFAGVVVASETKSALVWPLLAGAIFVRVLVSAFGGQRVRIGDDGLSIHRLGRTRFVPFRDVSEVRPLRLEANKETTLGVELVHKDGTLTQLAGGREGHEDDAGAAIKQRVNDAFEQHRLRAGATVEALTRGARSPAQWIAELRRRGAGGAVDARTAPLTQEALVRVMADPAQAPTARVGAAVALAAAGEAGLADRVRVIARTTTAAPLRVALERAIATDDAALTEAIEELEKHEAVAPTR